MDTIGIICAMPMEAWPLLKLVRKHTSARVGSFRSWTFETGPSRCVLLLSGMGLEPARQAAASLIKAENPGVIVSFGIAGAVGDGFAIGDVFLGERCRMWEDGAFGPPCSLAALTGAAGGAASDAARARGARCLRGTIVTSHGIRPIPMVPGEPAVVEMETAGVAQAAAARGIPVVSLRAVSDSPEEPIPFAMEGSEEFHIRTLALLGMILRRPSMLPALLRLWRNAELASRNLAEVVRAVITAGL